MLKQLTEEKIDISLQIMQHLADGKSRIEVSELMDIPLHRLNILVYRLRLQYGAFDVAHLIAILLRNKIIN